jgi:hypothetical protein
MASRSVASCCQVLPLLQHPSFHTSWMGFITSYFRNSMLQDCQGVRLGLIPPVLSQPGLFSTTPEVVLLAAFQVGH